MGHKVSVVHGVKSDHFYDQGNAINEIWVGDVEIVSRLPFGDSDQEQAGWPAGGVPKIPWHHFIIPLHKRDEMGNPNSSGIFSISGLQNGPCEPRLPTNGYLGMYHGVDEQAAYCVGLTLFILSAIFMVKYNIVRNKARKIQEVSFWTSKIVSEASEPGVDEAEIKRRAVYTFRMSFLRSSVFLIFAILLVILGVPAFAAAGQRVSAANWTVFHVFSLGLGYFAGHILGGIYLIARPTPWRSEEKLIEARSHYTFTRVEAVRVEKKDTGEVYFLRL
jgi:hypothetical protein